MAYQKIDTSGATKTASSQFSDRSPDRAFDGDLGTYWHSNGDAINQWIKIQFTSAEKVEKIRVYFSDTYYGTFKLEGSNDDSNWTIIKDNLEWDYNQWNEVEFTNNNSYTYYRFYCTAYDGSHWLKIMEWELYKASSTEVLSDISSDIRAKKENLSDIIQDIRFFKGTYKDIISDIRFSKPIFYDINTLIKVAKETFKDINSDIRTIKPYYNDILTNIKFKKNFVYVEWNAPSGFDGLGFTYYYTTDGSEPDDSSNYTTNTHIYWTLSEGLNILKIKVKDSLGNWGMTSSFRLVYSDNDIEGGVAN